MIKQKFKPRSDSVKGFLFIINDGNDSGGFAFFICCILGVIAAVSTPIILGKMVVEGSAGAAQYVVVASIGSVIISVYELRIINRKEDIKIKYTDLFSSHYSFLWILTLADILVCFLVDEGAFATENNKVLLIICCIIVLCLLPISFAAVSALFVFIKYNLKKRRENLKMKASAATNKSENQ